MNKVIKLNYSEWMNQIQMKQIVDMTVRDYSPSNKTQTGVSLLSLCFLTSSFSPCFSSFTSFTIRQPFV